ncbi:MAG: TonB-dependent receptor, partial [Parvularculaceae bacterium]|nr:TonB-dependent receptor [Parvularculaceae bacterium]
QRRLFAPGYSCAPIPGSPLATPAFGCDLSGKSIPYSPKLSGSVSAQYDFSLGSFGTLSPFAIVQYSSSWFGQPANSILDKQLSYAKVDLRLTWAYNDRFSLQGFVTNVTDKTTSTRFVYGGGGALQASYAPPRLWGFRADVKF